MSGTLMRYLIGCAVGRKKSVLPAVLLFVVAFSVMSAIPALSVSATEDRSCNVLKDSAGFFDHVQETGPRLTSRFFANLKKGATAEEIRSHLTNESILAHFPCYEADVGGEELQL